MIGPFASMERGRGARGMAMDPGRISVRRLALMALGLSLAGAAQAAAEPSSPPMSSSSALLATGPRQLAITYRAEPRNRAAFRRYLAGPMTRRLRALKAGGAIADFRIFFSWCTQP